MSEQQIEQTQAEIELLVEMIDALVATVGEAMELGAEGLGTAINGLAVEDAGKDK